MFKRWYGERKALSINKNESSLIDIETLKKQEEATKKLDLIYNEIDNQDIIGGIGLHEHICLFKMLNNDKTKQQSLCKKWKKNHPIQFPNKKEDSYFTWEDCDFCSMFCYIALDDEGKLMYASRTFPEDLIKRFEKKEDK